MAPADAVAVDAVVVHQHIAGDQATQAVAHQNDVRRRNGVHDVLRQPLAASGAIGAVDGAVAGTVLDVCAAGKVESMVDHKPA